MNRSLKTKISVIAASALIAGSSTAFACDMNKAEAKSASELRSELIKTNQNVDLTMKMEEGKCGEGKCGEKKSEGKESKGKEAKCGEGSCGEGEKSEKKESKGEEGKCGENTCGGGL